ncbi:MAG: hypothetical protein ACOYNC_06955 [Bacteroidales bacterium]
MKKVLLLCLLAITASNQAIPAGNRTTAGGRSFAMGGTSVARDDIWSLVNNPAGTAFLRHAGAALSFENRFLLKELTCKQFGLAIPTRGGTFGIALFQFGNTQYNEIKAGVSYARKLGTHFAVGVRLDYIRIHLAGEYGNKNLATCEIGLFFRPDKHLCIGVHLVNPVPVKIARYPEELLPSVLCVGISYRFSDAFLADLEVEKDLVNPLMIRAGAEYRMAGPAYARIGISTSPMTFTFGFGLAFRRIKLDVASGYHQALGFSPSGSFIYTFNEDKKSSSRAKEQ